MSQLVKVGENQSYKVKNKRITGVSFICRLIANAVNVALVPTDFTAKDVNITAVLYRNNKKLTIFADNMAALIAGSFGTNWDLIHPLNATSNNIRLLHAAAVVEVMELPFFLDFKGVLDLADDDELVINVQFLASALSGANITGNTTSAIYVVERDSRGYEFATPTLETFTFKAGESRLSFNLGSGVKAICMLQYDKDNILEADNAVSSLSLSSDQVNKTRTISEIMNEGIAFENFTYAEWATRRHSFMIYHGENGNLNNVNLDFQLNPANVTGGNCVLVVWRHTAYPGVMLYAHMKQRAEHAERLQRHGLPADPKDLAGRNALKEIVRLPG